MRSFIFNVEMKCLIKKRRYKTEKKVAFYPGKLILFTCICFLYC